ncbi:hypothetical protein C8Q74DRAFT_1233300 [Fomes fomentarius]|nr:hypothetical protein C8Q74DRAFT_1233300 [Fomes fomentarius]
MFDVLFLPGGIATSLALASVYFILAKGVKRRASQIQLSATIILYASTTIFWAANLHTNLTFTREAAAAAQAVSDCDPEAFFNPLHTSSVRDRMLCIETAVLAINILIGDAIVWWRTLVLWNGRSRYVILALCSVLVLSTFAISMVGTCQACNLNLVRQAAGYGQLFSGTKIGAAASVLSLVTNVTATLLTGYKAWSHATLLRTYFSEGTMITNVERIMILLTESGLVYGVIWLLVVVYQVGINVGDAYNNDTFHANYWGVIGYFVNGGLVPTIAIYPMAIIVLVALKKSEMEASMSTHSGAATTTIPVFSTHVMSSPANRRSQRFAVPMDMASTPDTDCTSGAMMPGGSDGGNEMKRGL